MRSKKMAKATEHFTSEVMEAFFAKRLSGDEEADILFHIDDCAVCGEVLRRASDEDELRRGSARDKIINVVFRTDHPKYEEVVAYVQGELTVFARRAVQDHIEDCAQCRLDVDGLRTSGKEARGVQKEAGTKIGARWKSITRRAAVPWKVTACLALIIILAASSSIWLQIWRVRVSHQTSEMTADTNYLVTNPDFSNENLNPASESQSTFGKHEGRQSRSTLPPEGANHQVRATTEKTSVLRPLRQPANDVIVDNGRGYRLNVRNELDGHHDLPSGLRQDIARALAGRLTVAGLSPALNVPGEVITRSFDTDEKKDVRPVKLKRPVNTKVLEDTLELGWFPLEGSDGYQVVVADENSINVWSSPILSETAWSVTLPRSVRQPTLYRWKVIPYRDGRRLKTTFDPGANFELVSSEKRASLVDAQRYSSHLALGVLYGKEGLHEKAECELATLQKKNPRSKIIRKLLRQLRLNKRPPSVELRCST